MVWASTDAAGIQGVAAWDLFRPQDSEKVSGPILSVPRITLTLSDLQIRMFLYTLLAERQGQGKSAEETRCVFDEQVDPLFSLVYADALVLIQSDTQPRILPRC